MSNSELKQSKSDLFLLRLWTDEADDPPLNPQSSVLTPHSSQRRRGRLLHIVSGEGHNFDDWRGLVDLLEEMLSPPDQQSTGAPKQASSESAGKSKLNG